MSFWSSVKDVGSVVGSKALDIGSSAVANSIANNQSYNMWQKQQDYLDQMNSPQRQVSRLAGAGLNPYLLSGNISAVGTAQSTQAASQVNDPANAYAQLQNKRAIDIQERTAEAQINNTDANTRSIEIKNATQLLHDLKELKLIDSQTAKNIADKLLAESSAKLNDSKTKGQDIQNDINDSTKEEQKSTIKSNAAAASGIAKQQEEKGKQEEINTKYLPKVIEQNLAESRSRANSNNASARASDASVGLISQQTLTEKERTSLEHYNSLMAQCDAQVKSLDTDIRERLQTVIYDARRAQSAEEYQRAIFEARKLASDNPKLEVILEQLQKFNPFDFIEKGKIK